MALVRTDEDLARLLAGGDAQAFEELVDRHQRRVRTLCYRLSGNLAEAEDLTQETFLRVFRHRDAYQPDRPFARWLKRICVNVCLTHRQRERPGRVVPLADVDAGPMAARAGGERDPAAHAAEREAARAVQEVIRELPEPFRNTLVLRVFGELSYQEIAEELGCSPGTVMSRLARARALVREMLEGKLC